MNQVTLDPALRLKYNVTNQALVQFVGDLPNLAGKNPPADWIFVWDCETGERKLFKGPIDPL